MLVPLWPLCIYNQILAYKKRIKTWQKNSPQQKKITFILCNFSVRTLWCFQKKILTFFLTPKKWKNGPQKLLIIGPDPFISQSSPDQWPTAQNWFSISWNLGTRHLFSYLWPRPLHGLSKWDQFLYHVAITIFREKIILKALTKKSILQTCPRSWLKTQFW